MIDVQFKALSDNAVAPKRGSKGAAGYDLYAAQDTTISKYPTEVRLDVALSIQSGHYGKIEPRSGLAFKHSVDTMAGIIDEDYTGAVKLLLVCQGDSTHRIKAGDRVAQIIFHEYKEANIIMVNEFAETERGANGFGSSGK